MANQEKHLKNPVVEWLEGEEGTVPASSRSSHVVNGYIKKSKSAAKKYRPAAVAAPAKADAPQLRDPGPQPKAEAKSSQAASWDHLRRVDRLTQLRAPYSYKGR
jgi:hypothetical protein